MTSVTPLAGLLAEDGALRRAYYGRSPVVLRKAVSIDGLPTSGEIEAMIDTSLLRWPYFTVFEEGVKPPQDEVTTSRRIGTQTVDGFVRPEGVRRRTAAGATFKMSQVEDWHRFTRTQVDELAALFPSDVTAFLFLTPKGKRGMLPHRDASRVVVIQLEGAKEWHLYHSDADENPDAGLDVDPATEVDSFVLEPGDVLYLPHAYGHAASAVGTTSLHITFTLTEPSPKALLAACLRDWLATDRMAALLRREHTLSADDLAAEVVAALAAHATELDPVKLVDTALAAAVATRRTS